MTEVAKVPKKGEYRLYKGEILTLGDILKRPLPIAVQRAESTRGALNLPRTFVIMRSILYTRDSRFVYFLDKGAARQVIMPLSVKFNMLTGRHASVLLNEHFASMRVNLSQMLQHLDINTIGTDPEVFVVDKNDAVIPAWTYMGSKKSPTLLPKFLSYDTQNHAYWDGFQAEFNVHPATCMAYMTDNVYLGLKTIHDAAKKVGGRLSHQSVLPVDPKTLASAADEHVEFGCMPSRNLYGLEGNKLPGRQVPMRFAGGHVHLALTHNDKQHIEPIVRALDQFLGLPCVSLFAAWDNPVRREFYGLPGEYRTPAHGVEYRALSNAWLIHPVLLHMVYETARVCTRYGVAGLNLIPETSDVPRIIQEADVDAARAYMHANKDIYTSFFKCATGFSAYGTPGPEVAYKAFYGGADKFIASTDIAANWNLESGWVNHSGGTNKQWSNASHNIKAGHKV